MIPVNPIAAIGFFLAVQFALGFLAGTPWLLALCVCPPIFAVAFPGAIPPDSDIVGYAGFIAYMLVWPIMPIGALISWGGVLLRPRSSRAIQRRSDG